MIGRRRFLGALAALPAALVAAPAVPSAWDVVAETTYEEWYLPSHPLSPGAGYVPFDVDLLRKANPNLGYYLPFEITETVREEGAQ